LDLDALTGCLASSACLVTQTTSGFIIGMLLFLVAVGLTLIFGVLKVVNFTHGSLYMLGAYFAFYLYRSTDSYLLAADAALYRAKSQGRNRMAVAGRWLAVPELAAQP